MSFEVPGYAVAELIGFGGSGEVWRARHEATGELVALKRLRTGADPMARDRLRREAALLSSLAGPHVVRLRDLLLTPSGPVLVLEHADGGNLASLLAARGPLTPAELVTLGLPLARTLADLHARGIVHGDLSPSNVLLTADGRPMIADLGVARLIGDAEGPVHGTEGYLDPGTTARGLPPTPASDVYALASIVVEAAAGQAPPGGWDAATLAEALRHLPSTAGQQLARARDPDPARRPSAAELAGALRSIATPAPLQMATGRGRSTDAPPPTAPVTPLPPAPPAPPAPPRKRLGRIPVPPRGVAVTVLVALMLLTGAVVGGLLWARGSVAEAVVPRPISNLPTAKTSEAASTTTSPRRARSWLAVMTELDAARDDAFTAGDLDALQQVYAPGSVALRQETDRMITLLDRRLVVRDLELRLISVRALAETRDSAELTVVDELAPYDLLDAAGRLIAHRPARGRAAWRVALVAADGRWRITAITPEH